MEIKRYEINEKLAQTAQRLNSFSDYVENSATNEYEIYIKRFESAISEITAKNKPTSEQIELIEYYADKYSQRLAEAINRRNRIDASCPSVMIVGGSNFPVRKKEKQNAQRDKFYAECGDLFNTTDNNYFNKIEKLLTNRTIYSNDELALEKLQNKLADKEELQAKMKYCNAYYRKNGTLKGYEDISEEKARVLDEKIKNSCSWEQQPYPSYLLTNNNAEIRRLKKRIEELQRLKEKANSDNDLPVVNGIETQLNAEAMRIQLLFDEIPSAEIREMLKSNGFRWSPKNKAWQRQLTDNAIYTTKQLLNKIKEMED